MKLIQVHGFTDDETGETTFYGTWGHDSDGCSNKGLRVNVPSEKYETEQTLAGVDIGVESRALQLDDKQQAKFEKYIAEMQKKGDNAWGYWYPCSNFAAKLGKKQPGKIYRTDICSGLAIQIQMFLLTVFKTKRKILSEFLKNPR